MTMALNIDGPTKSDLLDKISIQKRKLFFYIPMKEWILDSYIFVIFSTSYEYFWTSLAIATSESLSVSVSQFEFVFLWGCQKVKVD